MTVTATRATVAERPAERAAWARAPKQRRSPERIAAGLTIVALVVASIGAFASIDVSVPEMLRSWEKAERFLARVGGVEFPPLAELLHQTALTVGLVLCGTVLAALLSVPVAYLAAGNTTPGPGWRSAARFVSVLTRAIPDVVLAMVFVLMFSLGTLPGILAIGIHSIGMISKLFADAIEQIDEGPRHAIRAAGGTPLQAFTSGVLPQVLPSWVATVLHRNDINLRGSVVLGYVGVVGLGMEMSHAFKSLDYALGIGYALVILALCIVMEVVSSSVRSAMLGLAPQGRGVGDRIVRFARRGRPTGRDGRTSSSSVASGGVDAALRRPWTPARVRGVVGGWIAVAVVAASIAVCDIAWGDLVAVWAKIPAVAVQFWPPGFGNYDAATMFGALGETIMIALAATVVSIVLSVVLGSFAARNIAPNGTVRGAARLLLVVIRGIPEIILAILLIVITGLGSQAGTLALAVGGIGLLGKLLADSFEEVDRGPERALTAAGATRGQIYAGATLPQGIPALVGHAFYLLDTNIRAATLLGIVGAGGVGYYLLNAGQGANYPVVTAIVLLILATVLVVEGLAMWMRRVFR